MPGGLNLIGGLLRGMGQGRQQRLDREDKKQMLDMQKQLMGFKVSEQRTKQAALKMKSQGLQFMMDKYAREQQGPQNAEVVPAVDLWLTFGGLRSPNPPISLAEG